MNLINILKEKNKKLVLCITGGGTSAISNLLSAGGGSSVVLDAQVPYSKEALDKYLGKAPDKYCSMDTACSLASMSWFNAIKLGSEVQNAIGVGVTCSLAKENKTSEPERYSDGSIRPHIAYIAIHDKDITRTFKIELDQNDRYREDEEDLIGESILCAIRLSVDDKYSSYEYPFWVLSDNDIVTSVNYHLSHILRQDLVLPNNIKDPFCYSIGDSSSNILFSGSFNPFHEGHRQIAECIYEKYGEQVDFEISLLNRDKPPVDYFSLYNRIKSIPRNESFCGRIFVTNTSLFLEKELLFPNHRFVVGGDTWNRIVNDDENIISVEDKFIVVPRNGEELNRYDNSGMWINFEQLDINVKNISSTEIRRKIYERA